VVTTERIINYGDRWSIVALWAKAIFLLPIWAYLFLAPLGGFASLFGPVVYQMVYFSMLALGLAYFVEDILKRKVRIDENCIYFGYHSYKLANLASVGLNYSSHRMIPKSLILYFGEGKKLELHLSRLSFEDIQRLLTLVENKVAGCTIDPVITTLIRSKKLARKAAMDESDRTEIVYHSRRAIKEIQHTFMTTAESWTRLGPIITAVLFAPVWLSASKGIYTIPLASDPNGINTIALHEAIVKAMGEMDGAIGKGLGDVGTVFWALVSNPFIAIALAAVLIPICYHFLKLALKPNRLVLNASGISFNIATVSGALPFHVTRWDDLVSAKLSKPSETAGPEKWSINLLRTNGTPFKIDLAAVTPEDRSRLSRGIERWAPHCAMDPELTETLMPRQANSYTELWLQSLAAPPERASLEPLTQGRVLKDGAYEVVKRLGVGGQGAAYMCKHHMDTVGAATDSVVLKETIIPVFVEATIRKQALERFEQEARILKSLNSDFVVKLLDYFVEDHRGYLVLELIDGKSLRQLVEDKGALAEDEVMDLCAQMCSILEYLHNSGVIHRDFTPDNLILSKEGKLKLIDFNVAQQADEGTTGVVVGKQSYLPPEQFRGKPTTQSDIYAMGATLYFLLTGVDPEPISQSSVQAVVPSVSDKTEQVIMKSTALDSSKRYKSVTEIQKELRCTIEVPESPVEAPTIEAPTIEVPKSFKIAEPVEVEG